MGMWVTGDLVGGDGIFVTVVVVVCGWRVVAAVLGIIYPFRAKK